MQLNDLKDYISVSHKTAIYRNDLVIIFFEFGRFDIEECLRKALKDLTDLSLLVVLFVSNHIS